MDLTISVIVPSYRRPEMLSNCLTGLSQLQRPADQIVVVRRSDDAATAAVVAASPVPVVEVQVDQPGVLAAMRAGVARSTGAVVAFIDDDAVPRPDWLDVLLQHYDDPSVGGVGGRDVPHPGTSDHQVPSTSVGRFNSWGRHSGFHDVGFGPAADVEVLKGVNMSFRRDALALPRHLRGDGAEVHNEVAISLWARRQGWRLVYDPRALVDHYHGPRFDIDRRRNPAREATRNEAYNLVFSLLSMQPGLTSRRAAFGLLVGDRATPGLARAVVALARRQPEVAARLLPSIAGQLAALRDVAQGKRLDMLPAETLAAR